MSIETSLTGLKVNIVNALESIRDGALQVAGGVYRTEGEVYPGDVVEFILPAYDNIKGVPTIAAGSGLVELVELGDGRAKVRYTAPNEPVTDTVTVNRITISVPVVAKRITKPTIVSLTEGQVDVPFDYAVSTSPFASKPAGEFTHAATDWQIAVDAGFTTIVVETSAPGEHLILPSSLEGTTTYHVRARHVQDAGVKSEWSDGVSFTTASTDVQGGELQIISGQSERLELGTASAVSDDGVWLALGSAKGGSVYIHKKDGQVWSQTQHIQLSDFNESTSYQFLSMSGDGTVLAIGNRGYTGTHSAEGKVTLWRRTGSVWNEAETIPHPTPNADNYFGRAVALSYDGSRLAVSAPGVWISGTADNGKVFVFENQSGTWALVHEWHRTRGGASGSIGFSVDLSGDGSTVVVGSPYTYHHSSTSVFTGAMSIFREETGAWVDYGDFYPKSEHGGTVGVDVAVNYDGHRVVGSATKADVNGSDAGRLSIFKYTGSSYSMSVVRNGSGGYKLGEAVDISTDGTVIIAGAINAKVTDANIPAGLAWVMKEEGTSWTTTATLVQSDPAAYDYFGSVCLLDGHGRTAFVTASGDDNNGIYSGSVYIFN